MSEKIIVYCAYCDKERKVFLYNTKRSKNLFCDRKCYSLWRAKNLSGKNSPMWKKKIKIHCAYCKKEKKIHPSRKRKNNFCNIKCKGKWASKNRTGRKGYNWRGGKVVVYCSYCNKKKEVNLCVSKINNHHFCDQKCLGSWKSENLIGEDTPNWRGGTSFLPYCVSWGKETTHENIKIRDGYKCLNPCCWKTSNTLCIMHIDNNKMNCSPSNLITGCHSCNARAQKDRDWWTSWYQAIIYRRYKYIYERKNI